MPGVTTRAALNDFFDALDAELAKEVPEEEKSAPAPTPPRSFSEELRRELEEILGIFDENL